MPFNRENVEVPLSLFGGLDTELAPSDLPEGVSPKNNDVVYLPGSVATRPGLSKLYAALDGNVTITYIKTYQARSGKPYTIVLDSAGNIYIEDVLASKGTLTKLTTCSPGSYAKSATIFGREYLAFSDGENGTDSPILIDENAIESGSVPRITQDGPSAVPSVADLIESADLASLTTSSVAISGATVAINTETNSGIVTVTTSSAHGLSVGQDIVVAGTSRVQFNGSFTVTGVPSTTTFTYTVDIIPIFSSAAARSGGVTEIASTVPHNLVVGDTVSVSGGQDGAMDGLQTVTVIPSTVQWEYDNPGDDNSPAPAGLFFTPVTLVSATGGKAYTGATVVLKTAAENAGPGDPLTIAGAEATDDSFPFDNNVGDNPPTWNILTVSADKKTITFSMLGIMGLTADNGTINANSGTATVGGQSSQGQYSAVAFFINDRGGFSSPSPAGTFTSSGNAKFSVSYPIENVPANITQLAFAFTGAGGSAYFFIAESVQVPNVDQNGQPLLISATVVNMAAGAAPSTIVFNVSDNSLFAAEGIDIPGNDLFAQRILEKPIGFGSYAGRATCWGEKLSVDNFLNMGFDGGTDSDGKPSGWSVPTTGGAIVQDGAKYGNGWSITGSGGNVDGKITQPCFKDSSQVPIITAEQYNSGGGYFFRCWINSNLTKNGFIKAAFLDSDDSSAGPVASINLADYTGEGYYTAQFTGTLNLTASSILAVFGDGVPDGDFIIIDDIEIMVGSGDGNITTRQGLQFSYVDNPSAFDAVAGVIAPQNDSSPIQAPATLRDELVIFTALGFHPVSSQPSEPANWQVTTGTLTVGAISSFSVDNGRCGSGDSGEEWIVFASETGLFLYYGAAPTKISQEIQPTWDKLNMAQAQAVWVKNDVHNRRIYVGMPTNTSDTPDVILVLDYRELDKASMIENNGPIRVSYTGKMIASDICRKWSPWNLTMNCCQEISRGQDEAQVVFGVGNGEAIGAGDSFANVYTLDPAMLHDDDFGTIDSNYNTYFAVNHEQEQNFELGSGRKVLKQVALFISGTGKLSITPYADALTNPWPAFTGIALSTSPTQDMAIGFNVSAERTSIELSVSPDDDETDAAFNVGKVILLYHTHPVSQTVGSVV